MSDLLDHIDRLVANQTHPLARRELAELADLIACQSPPDLESTEYGPITNTERVTVTRMVRRGRFIIPQQVTVIRNTRPTNTNTQGA